MPVKRVYDPDDPRRCKKSTAKEQCWNQAVPGSDYCPAHGGTSGGLSRDKRMYLLSKAAERARLAQLAEHEQIKSLREEIALVRMMVERRFDAIQNENDLIAAFGPLTQAALRTED